MTEIDLVAQIGDKTYFGSSKRDMESLCVKNLLAHMICFGSLYTETRQKFFDTDIVIVMFSTIKKEIAGDTFDLFNEEVKKLKKMNQTKDASGLRTYCYNNLFKKKQSSPIKSIELMNPQFPYIGDFELVYCGMRDLLGDPFGIHVYFFGICNLTFL